MLPASPNRRGFAWIRTDLWSLVSHRLSRSFFKHEGEVIQTENYAISESPLKISIEATERLVQIVGETLINAEFPTFASGLSKRAMAAGYGNEEAAALIKVLRREA